VFLSRAPLGLDGTRLRMPRSFVRSLALAATISEKERSGSPSMVWQRKALNERGAAEQAE
jgi:hypothetical protein